jgi:hypothetical protein
LHPDIAPASCSRPDPNQAFQNGLMENLRAI